MLFSWLIRSMRDLSLADRLLAGSDEEEHLAASDDDDEILTTSLLLANAKSSLVDPILSLSSLNSFEKLKEIFSKFLEE